LTLQVKRTELVIIFPRTGITENVRLDLLERGATDWLYLGKNIGQRKRLQEQLGAVFKMVSFPRLLAEIAEETRLDHIRWIDEMNRLNGEDLEWWFGPISSRNIHSSNLFLYSCYLELLNRLHKGNDTLPQIIAVESFGLGYAVMSWAKKSGYAVMELHSPWAAHAGKLSILLFNIKTVCQFVLTSLLSLFAARIVNLQPINCSTGVDDVIINTYVHHDDIMEDGVFKDRYFPFLHDYLRRQGKNVLVRPVFYDYRYNFLTTYKRIKRSKDVFIVMESYLSLADYAAVFVLPLRRRKKMIKAILFRGNDYLPVIKEEWCRNFLSSALPAFLTYRFFTRLGGCGYVCKSIITWYENQVIDRAMIHAVRETMPGTRVIGAQLYISPPNYLNLHLSESEADANMAPHLLLHTCDHQCRKVALFAQSSIPCKVAAALRYQHLYEDTWRRHVDSRDEDRIAALLLPADLDESWELLEIAGEARGLMDPSLKLVVKGHPDYPRKKIENLLNRIKGGETFETFTGALTDLLERSVAVISANSSSMVEAAARGLPIVYCGRQTTLNQNLLAGIDTHTVREAYTAEELAAAVNHYLDFSLTAGWNRSNEGLAIRDIFFTPVNDETMKPFIEGR